MTVFPSFFGGQFLNEHTSWLQGRQEWGVLILREPPGSSPAARPSSPVHSTFFTLSPDFLKNVTLHITIPSLKFFFFMGCHVPHIRNVPLKKREILVYTSVSYIDFGNDLGDFFRIKALFAPSPPPPTPKKEWGQKTTNPVKKISNQKWFVSKLNHRHSVVSEHLAHVRGIRFGVPAKSPFPCPRPSPQPS